MQTESTRSLTTLDEFWSEYWFDEILLERLVLTAEKGDNDENPHIVIAGTFRCSTRECPG